MPELEVLCEYLGPRLVGEQIAKVSVSPKFGFLLRTPPADLARALGGRTIDRVWRRGKFLVIDAGNHPVGGPCRRRDAPPDRFRPDGAGVPGRRRRAGWRPGVVRARPRGPQCQPR